jgi:cell division protein ZapA
MSAEHTPISLNILDREYVVGCAPSERADLVAAATLVDERLRTLRATAKTASLDRLAVLVALNLAHELRARERDLAAIESGIAGEIEALKASLATLPASR